MKKTRRLSHNGHKLGTDAVTETEGGAATIRNSQSIQTKAEAQTGAVDAKGIGETKDEESEPEPPARDKPSSVLDLARDKTAEAYHASSNSRGTGLELQVLDLRAHRSGALLDVAERIMKAARETISEPTAPPLAGLTWWPYKSINKRRDARDKARQQELSYAAWVNARQMAYTRAKTGTSPLHMSMDQVRAFGARVAQEKVGNCLELSALTIWLLSHPDEAPGAEVDMVRLGKRLPTADNGDFASGDHAFVVLNPPKVDENGGYPGDFDDWGEAIIIDPWANIACKARDFPERWKEKMRKWKRKGKEIDTVTKDGAGTRPPDQQPWIDGIVVFEKISVTKSPPPEPAPGGESTDEHGAGTGDHHSRECAFCSVM
ncbi:hypothetical protein WME97_44400 [Sorangium sp. So ce367]|uniref:hypothetical protein n=1 Tax=Sorangium sp. So ce367 TaxID=3133305 RepID=UPI003F5D65D1